MVKSIFLLWLALLSTTVFVSSQDEVKKLLMVGNSYTYYNDLYQMLEDMLKESEGAVESFESARSGAELAGHYAAASGDYGENRALRKYLVTEAPDWKWVTLQEHSQVGGFAGFSNYDGPSIDAAVGLDALIADTGGDTVFFMTWGRRDGDSENPDIFPDFLTMNYWVAEGYQRYVDATSTKTRPTKVAPVGMAFEYIYRDLVDQGSDPLESGSHFHNLYARDGSHPSLQGSYLAACVIYATLTDKDPRTLVYNPNRLGDEDAERLQAVAQATVKAESPEPPTSCPRFSPIFFECTK